MCSMDYYYCNTNKKNPTVTQPNLKDTAYTRGAPGRKTAAYMSQDEAGPCFLRNYTRHTCGQSHAGSCCFCRCGRQGVARGDKCQALKAGVWVNGGSRSARWRCGPPWTTRARLMRRRTPLGRHVRACLCGASSGAHRYAHGLFRGISRAAEHLQRL